MSDAFGNDPLENARQAYSPLPFMVQRFREMTAGRPAPAPPQTIEQQAQDRSTRPDHSQIPAWNEPRRPNLALPPGAPVPPIRFSPFIGAINNRPPSQWGDDEPFPRQPAPHEVPGILGNLGNYFTQNGSQNVAAIAMMFGPYAGDFLKGVQQGQREKYQMAKEQLALNAAKLANTLEQEQFRYSNVLAEWSPSGSMDPKILGRTINGRTVLDALAETAGEIGDTGKPGTLGDLIQSGATVQDAINFLNDRDRRMRDLKATNKTLNTEMADDADWNSTAPQPTKPAAAEQPSTLARYIGAAPEAAPAATATDETGAPAPAAPAATQPQSADNVNPDAPSPDATPEAATSPDFGFPQGGDGGLQKTATKLTPHDAAVLQSAEGYELDTLNKGEKERQVLGGERLKADVENVISRNLHGDDLMRAVEAIPTYGSSIASQLRGVGDFQTPIGGQTGLSAGGKMGQWSGPTGILARLAQQYVPGWTASNYQSQLNFKNSNANQTMFGRSVSFGTAARDLINAVDDMPAGTKSANPFTRYAANRLGEMSGDEHWTARNAAMLRLQEDMTTIIKASGSGGLTETEMALHTVDPYTGTPAAYRRVVVLDSGFIKDRLDQKQLEWRQKGGAGNPPGWNQPAYDRIAKLANMEPTHGLFPGQSYTDNKGKKWIWNGNHPDDPSQNWLRP